MIGGVIGLFAFDAWAVPQPTECGIQIGSGPCMQDMMLGLSQPWIIVLFGAVGAVIGFALQTYHERSA